MTSWPKPKPKPGPELTIFQWMDLFSGETDQRDVVQRKLIDAGVSMLEVLQARVAHKCGGASAPARVGAAAPYGRCPCPEHADAGFEV